MVFTSEASAFEALDAELAADPSLAGSLHVIHAAELNEVAA
jgi:hypothetical protein